MKARLLLPAFLLLGAACAHAPSPEQREAYFTCPGVSVDEAAKNLGRAGYAVADRAHGAPVSTGWAEYELTQDGVTETLSFRLDAQPAGPNTTFTLVEAGPGGDTPWDEVTERQVAAAPYRALLNKLRRDVCGDDADYFPAP